MSRPPALALLLLAAAALPPATRGGEVFAIDGRPVEVVDVTRRTVVDLDDPDVLEALAPPPLPPTVLPTVEDEDRPHRPAPAPPPLQPVPRPLPPPPAPGRGGAAWLPDLVMGLLLAGVLLVGGRAALDARRRSPRPQAPAN